MTDSTTAARARLMTRYAITIARNSVTDPRTATDRELLARLAHCTTTPTAHDLPEIRVALEAWLQATERQPPRGELDTRLRPFAVAEFLFWNRLTLFAPHRGDDGTLITGDGQRLPLDTWLPDNMTTWAAPRAPMTDHGVGIAVVDPETLDDVHAAITAWCLTNLGRDDITFS